MKSFDGFRLSYKKRFILGSILFFAFFGTVIFLLAKKNERAAAPYELSSAAFNTSVSQKIYSEDGELISQEALKSLNNIENRFSWRSEKGDIWQINNVQDTPVKVSESTVELLEKLIDISKKTDRAYDPTNLQTVRAWSFDMAVQFVPENDALKTAVKKRAVNNIVLNKENNTVTVKGRLACLYLGDVLKGIAVDSALRVYSEYNADGGFIAIGETAGAIKKSDGSNWNIQIRNPKGKADDYIGTVSLNSGCISSKGHYQQFFVENNRVYHSIINPSTGMPANSGVISATVLSESGVLSEALAYAAVVAGIDKLNNYAQTFNAEIMAVTDNNEIYITKGLKDSFSLTDKSYTVNVL